MSHDPGHPGAVDDGWGLGIDRPRGRVRPLDAVRTTVATVAGLVALVLLAGAWLLAVAAVHVTSPEHPGRVVAVAITVPALRADAAASLASDVEEELDRPLAPADRDALVAALDDVLAHPDVERSMMDLEVVDGTFDVRPFLAVVAERLRAGSAASPVESETAQVLEGLATGVSSPELDDSGPMDPDVSEGLRAFRNLTLGAAGVLAVPALVAGALCVAVARRRLRSLVVVVSGSLALAALALTGVGAALAPADVGAVLAALARAAGSGPAWLLLLVALVPVAVLAAVSALRPQRASSTITS